jgi:glucosylceramidase
MHLVKTVYPHYRLLFCGAAVFFSTGTIHALSATDTIQAESFSGQSGVTTEACSEGGQNITSIQNNDNIHFSDMDFGSSGIQCFEARIASYGAGGYIEVRLDSLAGALAGTCEIQPETGSWQTWTNKACSVTGAAGVHTVYLKFTGGAGDLFNMNWFKFHGTPSITEAGWRQTTQTAKGVWKGMQPLSDTSGQTPVIEVFSDTLYQRVFGWGGAFNDVGAASIDSLPAGLRAAVMKEIFDPVNGCKFNVGRVPIGISDFSLVAGYYSLNETAGDYSMTNFSIAHDRIYNIPFCKEAMTWQPNLMIYATPWTPPTWMKSNNKYDGAATLNQNAQTFTAYALYFRKFVQSWKQEGVPVFVVFPQNEPGWNVASQPACGWTGAQLKNFVRDYLYPDFNANGIMTQIWMGTFHMSYFTNDLKPTLDDAVARTMIKGCGTQRQGALAMDSALKYNPSLNWHAMETETMCWSGANSWTDAMNTYKYICGFETANTNYYNFWNMILNSNSNFGWQPRAQNSMVTINTTNKTVTYNPEFYIMKHFSYYIGVGAVRVKATNTNTNLLTVAFKNPDGTIILEVQNTSTGAISPLIKVGSKVFTPALPASSVNTFNIGGTEPASNWVPATELQYPPHNKRPIAAAKGTMGIYDIKGRLIKVINRASTQADARGLLWDHIDACGRKAAPGLYIIMNRTGKGMVRKAICQ